MTDITLGRSATSNGALLDRAIARLRLWRSRYRARRELVKLSPRDLRDIGLTPAQAGFEADKPFWRG
jgi:uncharacterized protein YjiS (DUF1127 family)